MNVNDPFSFVFLYFFYVHTCRLVCSSFIKTLKAHFEMRSFSIEMNKMEFNAVYSVCL